MKRATETITVNYFNAQSAVCRQKVELHSKNIQVICCWRACEKFCSVPTWSTGCTALA